jgi:hypothetical protein
LGFKTAILVLICVGPSDFVLCRPVPSRFSREANSEEPILPIFTAETSRFGAATLSSYARRRIARDVPFKNGH